MAFSKFSASLDPEALNLLTRAFEAACEEAQHRFPGSDAEHMRQLLAASIFQAYSQGERDPAALRNAALHGILSN